MLKITILSIVFCLPIVSWASSESIDLKISLFRQSCNRPDATKPYSCGSSRVSAANAQITLDPTTPDVLEDEAYSGNSGELWTSAPSEGQFVLKASVYKAISFGGRSVRYDCLISSQKFSTAPTPVFTITAESTGRLILPRPMILMADRYEPNDRFFTQIYYDVELVNP